MKHFNMEDSKHLNDTGAVSDNLNCKQRAVKVRKQQKPKKNPVTTKMIEDKITSTDWKCSSSSEDGNEEGFGAILLAWGRERALHLLGLFCLLMCAFLFALQAYMAFRSYQILHQITTKKQIPEILYQIYFDGHDWALDLDKVDLRANTSLFMH